MRLGPPADKVARLAHTAGLLPTSVDGTEAAFRRVRLPKEVVPPAGDFTGPPHGAGVGGANAYRVVEPWRYPGCLKVGVCQALHFTRLAKGADEPSDIHGQEATG